MGGVHHGKSATWEECIMGGVHHGRSASWEECIMGRVHHGKSASWEDCIMGGVHHGKSAVDLDVVVAVAARVLVVEAQRVQQLVLDDAVMDAAEPLQRHHLLVSDATEQREAAGGREGG
ncbi:hypothetical protein EYF80_054011 [Liparis tanakae]|uniref:Uncharacterized protein n=1 Tax=Liparis tanakae TaxID=230148 RepID=A0A4Z2F438_9TELE|nr:hypothetical protein EYF80_054011 [Liparis tanakae]